MPAQTSKNSKKFFHIALTLAVMIFIFVQSAMPGQVSSTESNFIVRLIAELTGWETEPLKVVVRKAAHFTEFMVLGMCLAADVKDFLMAKARPLVSRKIWLVAWLIGTAYAVTDEFHQYFVPERACTLLDVCIDSAGVAVGALIVGVILKRKKI